MLFCSVRRLFIKKKNVNRNESPHSSLIMYQALAAVSESRWMSKLNHNISLFFSSFLLLLHHDSSTLRSLRLGPLYRPQRPRQGCKHRATGTICGWSGRLSATHILCRSWSIFVTLHLWLTENKQHQEDKDKNKTSSVETPDPPAAVTLLLCKLV